MQWVRVGWGGGVFTQQSSVQYDVYRVFACRWNRLAVASDQAASTNDEQVEFSGPLSKVATIGTQLLVLYREASLIQG